MCKIMHNFLFHLFPIHLCVALALFMPFSSVMAMDGEYADAECLFYDQLVEELARRQEELAGLIAQEEFYERYLLIKKQQDFDKNRSQYYEDSRNSEFDWKRVIVLSMMVMLSLDIINGVLRGYAEGSGAQLCYTTAGTLLGPAAQTLGRWAANYVCDLS